MNNNYPKYVITQIFQQVFENQRNINSEDLVTEIEYEENEKKEMLVLPYQGIKGDFIMKSMKKRLHNLLPRNIKIQVAFTGKKTWYIFSN